MSAVPAGIPDDRALLWRWFRRGWAGEGARMVWLLVGSALGAVGHAAFTGLWGVVIVDAQRGTPWLSGGLLVAVGAAQALLNTAVQGTRSWMNQRIQQTTRDAVFEHVTRLGPGALAGRRVGDLVTRFTDDISEDKLSWFLCSGVFRAYEALLVAIACFCGMLWVDPWVAVQSLAPLPLLIALFVLTAGTIAGSATAVQAAISRVATVVTDSFDGVRVLQARGLAPLAERAFAATAAQQSEAEIGLARRTQANFLLFAYGWQLALAALLWAGGRGLLAGTLTPAAFVVMSGYLLTMVFTMFDLAAFVVRGRVAAASLRRLEELLLLPVDTETRAADGDGLHFPIEVTTAHLTVRLRAPLDVAPGALLAVAGPIAAGKSTLLRAIAGEEAGVRGIVRPAVAWVPQAALLLARSLRENVSLGGDPAVELAVSGACLEEDLRRFPAGLDTVIGERGVTLSGGQQQRVQIARALAARAPLLLFDDATSALDADTEARFWAALPRADRVIVAVTHRPATLAMADVVLYLRDGVEVARGPHGWLLESQPAYLAAYGSRSANGRAPGPAAAE